MALIGLALRHIPVGSVAAGRRPDLLGSVTVTAGLLAVIYAISTSAEDGWTSVGTLGSLAAGIALLVAFVLVERAVTAPLVPLAMFRRRTLTGANLVALLAFGSFYATIFVTTLFMQQVLGYSATRAGVAWIAATATAFVVALRLSARVVARFGAGTTLVVGQLVVAVAALLLSRADAGAAYWVDLFPGFVLLGIGIGVLRMATQAAAFVGIEPRVMGLAGGMIETARELGGALGTAIAATVAATRIAPETVSPAARGPTVASAPRRPTGRRANRPP